MIVSEIITAINQELDLIEASNVISDTDHLYNILEGYTDMCRFTECLEKSVETVIPALSAVLTLPTDYLRTTQYRWSYNKQLFTRTSREVDEKEDSWPFKVGTPDEMVFQNYDAVRIHPFSSSAGTVTHRYAYYPTALQLTDEPLIQRVFHTALVDYGTHAAALVLREMNLAGDAWDRYDESRRRLRKITKRKTTDYYPTQRPMTNFSYRKWDWRAE